MNKSAIFSIFFAVVSVLVIGGTSVKLASVKEEVTISQTVLVGDESLVTNIQMNLITYDQYMNSWEMNIPLSAPEERETTFCFNVNPWIAYPNESEGDFYLGTSVNISGSTMGTMDFELMEQEQGHEQLSREMLLPFLMLKEVASATPLGETHSETLSMADYYDYLPLSFNIFPKGARAFVNPSYDILQDYFKFPVHPEIKLNITVEKSMEGVKAYSVKNAGDITSEILASYVMVEDGIIAATQSVTYQVSMPDEWSIINEFIRQEETQITKISWNHVNDGNISTVEINDVYEISTLDSSYTIFDMVDLGENLGVLQEKKDQYSFSVRDKESFEELQSVPLSHDGYTINEVDGAFLIVSSISPEETARFTVLEQENDHVFIGLEGEDRYLLEGEENKYYSMAHYNYHKGHLSMIREYRRHDQHLGDIFVKVFDESGMYFASLYESSQTIQGEYYNGIDYVQLFDQAEITYK